MSVSSEIPAELRMFHVTCYNKIIGVGEGHIKTIKFSTLLLTEGDE